MASPRDSSVRSTIADWLTRVLGEAGAEASSEVVQKLQPEIERALRAAALDMLQQCGVAQLGESEAPDAVQEWNVSVNEAVTAAIMRLEHQRRDDR